ncbi:MAG: hypothetical protein S4CHLAM2_14790 [Chlamydiales bacterium]|nr:hypothetical protein [Chlamydiales bacterium]
MKLINTKTSQSLVEFEGDRTIFYNKYLEKEMRSIGIPVPHGMRGIYNGKECIRLEDAEFQQAFREIYYLTTMNPETFRWQDF